MRPRLLRVVLGALLSTAAVGPTAADQEDWNTRERQSLDQVVYPQAVALPDFPQIKATLEKALAQDSSAVPGLLALVKHSNEYVAMAATRALGRFPGEEAASLLKQTFATEQRSLVRGAALVGLARMRDADVATLAIAVLDDHSAIVQAAAVGSLSELGNSANSAALIAFYDRNPDETVLEALGHLGDPPGSTLVRDKLVAESFKKDNDTEMRMAAARALRAMGREDLARHLFDWDATVVTYQSIDMVERRIRTIAATRNMAIRGQGDVDILLRDALASNHDFARQRGKDEWGRQLRVRFIREGQFRVISDGPDRQPDTADDISSAEPSAVYVRRIFPDLF